MALDNSALLELLGQLKLTDVSDRVRVATETLYQELIDAEAAAFIGAGPYERSTDRVTQRNGVRQRLLTTTAGDLQLKIPKLRAGTFFPSLLERRRRVDQALFAVVMEAYLHGVSTRKVDDLVKALGADTGISKSEVSRICADLDQEVAAFRDRDLTGQAYPYVFLDATYCKARVNHRVVSQAIVVAVGVAADGHREVLGFDVGDSENEAFWTEFLRGLKARGLNGVRLVISDAHAGLIKAITVTVQGASWQRCRVHFMRNVLAVIPKGSQEMVGSIIRTIFAQPDKEHVNGQFDEVTKMLERSHPKVATMLNDARPDLLAFASFPPKHWRQIWSTNPLERVNKEIKRRTDVVGVFPNPAAMLRLAGSVLVEQHDEWEAGERRYFSEASMKELDTTLNEVEEVVVIPELAAA
ncbi:IS256 family transposase [Subtercola endophyticus]|uniref:IS256 family transposase n=1 Tax=Subtercola endophyticus TaxID=2895559 RepID=UPI001E2B55CB|nr:IS256 family transposase [Subtercola endophyticus]UFS61058.1 IS256 family transposase [Subtercola endophyticus]UFS61164.1 IS256 family transposase [Subtercola endophyticus]UFS61238.1 IS256 family transposase [Subtercola endophyticus]